MSSVVEIQREKTAIKRHALSRPLRIALEHGLVGDETTILDFGCGRGDDVENLQDAGYEARGWDPVHRPEGELEPADVVNLGYVVNVIEDPEEREEALQKAWSLAGRLLLVSARLTVELEAADYEAFGDGFVTERGTFQKFYTQSELRDWINSRLDVQSVAVAPGIFTVFRDEGERQEFLAKRQRRSSAVPTPRRSDVLFEEHQDKLTSLREFFAERGRLPSAEELANAKEVVDALGSIRRAFSVVRIATGRERWDKIEQERAEDLLVYLALQRFGGRPRFSDLREPLRLDVRAFHGAYTRACETADELLFSAGDRSRIDAACKDSPIGKLTRDALYVHQSGLRDLPAVLRVYEGCARAYIGEIEGASVIKLYRQSPRISYLAYEDFDSDPHPVLKGSFLLRLDDLEASYRSYEESDNPPILHRKELLVPLDYPRRETFARLTQAEEDQGLYDEPTRIGWKNSWAQLLEAKGLRYKGHQLVHE